MKAATSGGDTDGDVESLQYDSDTPSDKVSSMRSKMAAQLPNFSKSFDDTASRAREERKREKIKDTGRTSPTFLDKVNALFRSDSSDSSAPPSPTKPTPKKPSLLKGIMDLALESTGTIATNLKEPSSPTSVRSTMTDNSGYAPSVQSDPGLYRSSSGVSSMGLPPRRKKNSSPFPKGELTKWAVPVAIHTPHVDLPIQGVYMLIVIAKLNDPRCKLTVLSWNTLQMSVIP